MGTEIAEVSENLGAAAAQGSTCECADGGMRAMEVSWISGATGGSSGRAGCKCRTLEFFSAKSQTMWMRGKFQWLPIIKFAGGLIRAVTAATVVGVVFDSSLSFAQYAASIVEKEERRMREERCRELFGFYLNVAVQLNDGWVALDYETS
ncbi:hypothetical protein EVAR_8885_1 [Eumeta japonica]|uniref:Uncharacterized protein n=1 Tax=Eumeta variegata TaxID=151549 RepID=A0A4C1U077_EUMVA|nr:hypothetical protein EVAR_8885_1 [Eumeta japonica]